MMKNKIYRLLLAMLILPGLVYFACEGPDQPVYGPGHPDPNPTGLAPAQLDSLSPNIGYLKEIVTFHGSGFNANPDFNFVLFGSNPGKVLQASPTELQVQAPLLVGDSIGVRVAVKGSEFWSDTLGFTFQQLPPPEVINEDISWPNGVAVDDDENVFVGSGNDAKIYRITPAGEMTSFADVAVSGSIHFGPEKYLYVCMKNDDKIVRISPDGSTIEDVINVASPVDFVWDGNKNMYVVSNSGDIFKVVNNEAVTAASLSSPKNCRIFEGYLYINDIWEGQIVRLPITTDGLGEVEVVLETDSPSTLELDYQGTLFFAKAWETSLFVYDTDGSEYTFFEGELMTPMRYTAFKNRTLYFVYPGWADVGMVMKAYIGVQESVEYGILP